MPETVDLVLVHGWMGGPGDWDVFRQGLPSTFREYACCLPGHDEQRSADIPSWPSLIHQMASDILGRYPERKPWLVGYSLGGRVCLEVAAAHPDRFSGLCLLGARTGWPAGESKDHRIQNDEKWAERIRSDFPTMLRDWYAQDLFARVSASADFETLLQRRGQQEGENMADSLLKWSPVHQVDRIPFLQFWQGPRLWICGEEDKVYRRMGRELQAAGCFNTNIEVPDAGHALLWENPQACAQAVTEFINRHKERA